MLQRREQNGVVFYSSALLSERAVPHAFSTRLGGVSGPPFDSLNLGNPNGCDAQDALDHIAANYRRLQSAANCGGRQLCRVHQVHGSVVARVVRGEDFNNSTKADALLSDDPTRVMSVRVADCVPILLCTADGRSVGAVHAGWRGVVAGVVGAAIAELKRGNHGARAEPIAAIGPCIGSDSFEVGAEVLDAFASVFGEAAPTRRLANGKGAVDLPAAVRLQLIEAGVSDGNIDTTDRCTYRDSDEFFSHRREKGVTGRMAAIITTSA